MPGNKDGLKQSARPFERHVDWLRLDNAARIYVAMMGSRSPTAFRIAVATTETVDSLLLQKSLDTVMTRFPYFGFGLRHGLFWHFLQKIEATPEVQAESGPPCADFTGHGHLFRVMYYGKRISAEFSHVLSDGVGALAFMQSLIVQYFRLGGCRFEYPADLYYPGQEPSPDEVEDAYERFYTKKIPHFKAPGKAYHPSGKLVPRNDVVVVTGTCPKAAVLAECEQRKVTLSDYLSAHYLWALYCTRGRSSRDIRLMVPVNLRGLYPSKTIRNFFLTVWPGIRPRLGKYTFDEILRAVHMYMEFEVDKRFINQQIARNVALARNPLARIVPLFPKLLFERMLFTRAGSRPASGIFSNLGNVKLPAPVAEHIRRFVFITSPNHVTKFSLGVAGFEDHVTMTFASLIQSMEIPRLFFTALRKHGIAVTIETNRK